MNDKRHSLEIVPLTRPPTATVRVPESKSITNRALILAALSDLEHGCTLRGPLQSEDTEVMVQVLRQLGLDIHARWQDEVIQIRRAAGARLIPAEEADLFVANSGTTMRFVTALVSLGQGRYRIDGIPCMRERPIEDLLAGLRQLGVNAHSERHNGCPPVVIEARGLMGGPVRIKGDISSQFLSGLLMAAPRARGDITIQVAGALVSVPYVAMTVAMIRQFGAEIDTDSRSWFHVRGQQDYRLESFSIEPDASAAGYFFGIAAITGGALTVSGLSATCLQGDIRFVDVLQQMGCKVVRGEQSLAVKGGPLRGIDVDMNDISDCVMTLAAVACFAEGPTTIRNVAHIRHKESDRLHALATELRRVGAEVAELTDGLTITPRPLHGAEVETYNDHRMAMSMALIGLRVPGIVIRNPGCVAKTYPRFFDDLEKLRC